MIKNLLILILAVLLGISTYLLYHNKNITIDLGRGGETVMHEAVTEAQPQKEDSQEFEEGEVVEGADEEEVKTQEPIETLEAENGPEVHLDPTVGMKISTEQQIVSNYKIIGPRKFSLLTDDDETMVEIDLDTGNVEINPKYEVDEVTTQFWKSIGKKYPEVCFVE
jgi:uncharacterized transporter YbjL